MPSLRRFCYLGLFGSLALLATACEPSLEIFEVERAAEFLQLSAEQKQLFVIRVETIIDVLETYRETVFDPVQGHFNNSLIIEQAREQARQEILANVAAIEMTLTSEQRKRFKKVYIPTPDAYVSTYSTGQPRRNRLAFPQMRATTRVKPTRVLQDPPPEPDSSFEELKKRWTITFGPGGQASGLENFPLIVTATLMDQILIEAEIRQLMEREQEAGISLDHYRDQYYREQKVWDTLSVRVTLTTYLHESYLDPQRWTIFLEDNKINQTEPIEIEVQPPSLGISALADSTIHRDNAVLRKDRQLVLRFPRRDVLGHPLIKEDTRYLRLVFASTSGEGKVYGEWLFQ